ncbi:hypothetical protein WA026_017957 [Henosepilachna vigintioctopunctata]|uniref:Luciferin 4-monooxygenase n=1 Tax=Henosepilachna vigintioctopunctata TaxID=420089 RepID=A0AAW1TZE6_9CUCU
MDQNLLEPIPDISFGEVIYQQLLKKLKHQPALIDGHSGEKITYSELLKKSCWLSEALINSGYGSNVVIAISSKNSLEYFQPVIASLFIGAIIVPLNPDYTNTELNHVLEIFKPKIIFCSPDILHKFMKKKEEMNFIEKIILIDTDESAIGAESLKNFIGGHINGSEKFSVFHTVDTKNQIAFLLCSSGTTGLPKGVMVTHHNLNTVFIQFRDSRIYEQDVTSICVPPFYHAYGLFSTLMGILTSGPTVFLRRFEGKVFLKSIEDYKVNRMYLVPPLLLYLDDCPFLKDYDLSSISEAICAAAPLKESTERTIKERLNLKVIKQAYGLTESTYVAIFNQNDGKEWKPGSCGKILPYMQLAVMDRDTGEFLEPNKTGEICIKGDMIMKGYYDNPKATQNAFTDNGWFLTGDEGYYDEEGYVYITDRIKELLKYKGYQVAPAELEGVLLTHEDIVDCAVIGVPDDKAGELPLAFVVKKKGALLHASDVQNFVQAELSSPKWLRGGVVFLDEIPKSAIGKTPKKQLRCLLENNVVSIENIYKRRELLK